MNSGAVSNCTQIFIEQSYSALRQISVCMDTRTDKKIADLATIKIYIGLKSTQRHAERVSCDVIDLYFIRTIFSRSLLSTSTIDQWLITLLWFQVYANKPKISGDIETKHKSSEIGDIQSVLYALHPGDSPLPYISAERITKFKKFFKF